MNQYQNRCQSKIYTIAKTLINQGFSQQSFQQAYEKASESERTFLNYIFAFLLHRKCIYVSNGFIAARIGVDRRTVIRYFNKYSYFFVRQKRYKQEGKRNRQISSMTKLADYFNRIEVLRWLARLIKSIRRFPYLLLTGIVSASMLLSQSTGLSTTPFLAAIGLSHLNKKDFYINERTITTKSNFEERTYVNDSKKTKKERSITQAPQKRSMMKLELPQNLDFSMSQRQQWLATAEDIQQKALQALHVAVTVKQQEIRNKVGWLLKTVDNLKQAASKEKALEQKPVRKAQAYAPSIEQRAQAEAEYNTLERLQDKLRGRRFFLQRSTTTGAERAALEETAVVLERAIELRTAMHLEVDKPKEQQQKATPAQIDIAKYLATLMPENIKQELILEKANGNPMTQNNPVLDYILADYLRQNQARGAEGA